MTYHPTAVIVFLLGLVMCCCLFFLGLYRTTVHPAGYATIPKIRVSINMGIKPYILVINPFILVINPFILVINPFILVINPFLLVIIPFILVINPFSLVINPFILSLPGSYLCHQGLGWPCLFMRYNLWSALTFNGGDVGGGGQGC